MVFSIPKKQRFSMSKRRNLKKEKRNANRSYALSSKKRKLAQKTRSR